MLKDTIRDLFRKCEPDVQEVLARVLEEEWAKLSYDKPRGIIEQVRQIIDAEAGRSEDET